MVTQKVREIPTRAAVTIKFFLLTKQSVITLLEYPDVHY